MHAFTTHAPHLHIKLCQSRSCLRKSRREWHRLPASREDVCTNDDVADVNDDCNCPPLYSLAPHFACWTDLRCVGVVRCVSCGTCEPSEKRDIIMATVTTYNRFCLPSCKVHVHEDGGGASGHKVFMQQCAHRNALWYYHWLISGSASCLAGNLFVCEMFYVGDTFYFVLASVVGIRLLVEL